ncbi:hypothetical protein HA402_012889 [Bradysia odoriphaga]|nr:hypothetical protein HA402_012889 [Bradysia odoriphaga]
MERKRQICSLIVLFAVSVQSIEKYVGETSIGKRQEYLDSEGKYLVQWEAYTDTQTIVFQLTVETTGYVGFGISPVGGMTGADIVIGGVYPNATHYFSNRHGVGNRMPEIDDNETWELLEASENGTHTYLKVGRQLDTCDLQDVVIGNSTTNFIWSMGTDDNISYHGERRGTSANIILDPPMPPIDTKNFQFWRMSHTMEMPARATTYWCTIQKSPPLPTKHHIVGYRPILETPEALKYTHHFIVHKCRAPTGSTDEEYFEKYIDQPGDNCYEGSRNVPTSDCETYLFLWAVGGKPVVFPDHTGYPFAVDGKQNYYMLEVHLDNPQGLAGLTFETGLEIFYTSQLRTYDAATITAGHTTTLPILIPPKSESHMIVGHCAPNCSAYIPETGIHVFNVLLHSHLAGRKLRLRHFRDGEELPWIATDDNYDFNFQQNRPLLEEVTILPGDQLIYECTYNSMDANGTVVGGLSTSEEMCNAFIVYYPEIDLDVCSSMFPEEELKKEFGIDSYRGSTWNPTITAPENMANKTFTEVLDTMVDWSEERRAHLQQRLRYDGHLAVCGLTGKYFALPDLIEYPNVTREYAPADVCSTRNLPGSGTRQAVTQSLNIFAFIFVAFVVMLRN